MYQSNHGSQYVSLSFFEGGRGVSRSNLLDLKTCVYNDFEGQHPTTMEERNLCFSLSHTYTYSLTHTQAAKQRVENQNQGSELPIQDIKVWDY